MPFKSKAQQGYLFSKKPKVAKRFADDTPKSAYKSLPEKVKAASKKSKKTTKKSGRK